MGLRHRAYDWECRFRHSNPLTSTTQCSDNQDLDGLLLVRCYFCTLVAPARDARSHRGIWVCAACYPTPGVRAVICPATEGPLPEEVP
jgi:hypothetical protein